MSAHRTGPGPHGRTQLRSRRASAPARAFAALLACAAGLSVGADKPREYIDDQSGVTVTAMSKPMEFALDRHERRIPNMRDYVTMTAASVDRQGHLRYLLIAYLWSTLDARNEPQRPVPDAVMLLAGEEHFRLDTHSGTPADFGIVRPIGAPSGRTVKTLLLVTDLETLGRIAAASSLQVEAVPPDARGNYRLWDDQRKALGQLVSYLNGGR